MAPLGVGDNARVSRRGEGGSGVNEKPIGAGTEEAMGEVVRDIAPPPAWQARGENVAGTAVQVKPPVREAAATGLAARTWPAGRVAICMVGTCMGDGDLGT